MNTPIIPPAMNPGDDPLFSHALDHLEIGVVIADAQQPDYPVIYINTAFERLTGYSQDDILGRNCRLLQGIDLDQPDLDRVRQALVQGQPCRVTLRNYRKDNSLFWSDLRLMPIRNADGQVSHFIGYMNDISASLTPEAPRVPAAASSSESEERYRMISELGSDYAYALVWNADQTGYIDWVTHAGENITGYTLEELNQRGGLAALVLPEDLPVTQRGRMQVVQGLQHTMEFRIRARDGQVRWLRHHSKPIWNTEENRVVRVYCAAQDITDQKQAEAERLEAERLRVMMEREAETITFREKFISMVSHEFRTPLTGIVTGVRTLLNYEDRLSPQHRRTILERLDVQSQYMTALVNDVLTIKSARAGHLPFEPALGDAGALCRRVIDALQHALPQYPHTYSLDLPVDLPPLMIDERLLTHILMNLVGNAAKYSPAEADINVRLRHAPGWLHLEIHDFGIGIPPEALEHLFEPFYRADNARQHQGAGLGLTIVEACVAAWNGQIRCDSVLSQGTTFYVDLPVT